MQNLLIDKPHSLKTKLSNKMTFLSSAVVLISLSVSFATCYFATPTVFGGRDQGAIATAAIDLAKHKSFTFSTPASENLFQKYGPGRALNYPGFDYTKDGKLTTRFPKVYVVYLAGLYSMFGLAGIQFANFLPLFLFLVLFWLTLRHLFSENVSFGGFLTAATFFPFLWFAKYTLTEIFMLFLVWAGIYCLIRFIKEKKYISLYIALFAFAISALTRIEGITFFFLAAAYIILFNRKNIIALPKNFYKYLFISIAFLLIFYISLNFHDLADSAKNFVKALLPNSTKDSAPSAGLYSHLFRLFVNYGFIVYLILGLTGTFLLNVKKNWMKVESLPILVLFPSFFYLISPMISLDDPWIFRRYTFAVSPALIFYTIYFLNRFFGRKLIVTAVLMALVFLNITISSQYFRYSENQDLLPQIENISHKFGLQDLILVDRLATGSGWSLISEPLSTLYSKQAVYFFNADDLKFINKNNYKNIYLIAPLDVKQTWYDSLNKELVGKVVIDNNYLEESEGFFSLAQNIDTRTINGIWKLK